MAMTSTEKWAFLLENFTQSTQVMENLTTAPELHAPLDLSSWVETLTLLSTNISILLSVFLVVIFQCIDRENNNFVNYLIQFLAVDDIFFCIGMDMGIAYYAKSRDPEKSGSLCVVQSFICTFSDLVSFFYTFYVILYVFCVNNCSSEWMKGRTAKRIYHSVAWAVPAVITISALSRGALGDATSRFGSWCWIKENSLSYKERFLWMLFTKQIWELSIYVFSMILIILTVWSKLRRRRKSDHSIDGGIQSSNEIENTPKFNLIVWILFYFYFTRIWGTIRNMVRIVGLSVGSTVPGFVPFEENFFIHAQSLGDSMQGTMNFFLICTYEKYWCQVGNKMGCKCCSKHDDESQSENNPLLK